MSSGSALRQIAAQGIKLRRLEQVQRWRARLPDLLRLVRGDETELCLLPLVRACWHTRGQRRRIPTPGVANPTRTLFGALDAVRGTWRSLVRNRRTSVHFQALLEQVDRCDPTGRIVVALDRAPAHTAKRIQRRVAAHPRLRLRWLPKDTAHAVNPVERIWWQLKGTVAANRYYGAIARLVHAADRCFAECTLADLLRLAGREPLPNVLPVT